MNIVSAVNKSFDKYGSNIEVISDDDTYITKGFVQPLNKNSRNYEVNTTDVSSCNEMRYMLFAKADTPMSRNDIVKYDNTLFKVIIWQKYLAKDDCVYKWAIMRVYSPCQEDDFCA